MRKPSIYDERYTDSPPGRNRLDTVERGRAKKRSNDDYDDDEIVSASSHSNVSIKKKEQDSLFGRYSDLMILHPLSMNASQAFIITALSVLISQRISGMKHTDWFEVLNAAVVSSLWITPILLGIITTTTTTTTTSLDIYILICVHPHSHTYTCIYFLAWFRAMSKIPTGTLGKILIDQICFSPIFTATIVSWRTLLSGKVSNKT